MLTKSLMKDPLGMRYYGTAILYAVTAYVAGFAGLFAPHWGVNALGTILLAHGMVIAAYLIHECRHKTIFRSNEANARLGRFLNWISGSSYGTFEDIRYKHFRHHMDNDDSVWFEYEEFFERHPGLVRIIKFLEWFYIPAHEFLMHGIMMFSAFIIPQRRDQRLGSPLMIVASGLDQRDRPGERPTIALQNLLGEPPAVAAHTLVPPPTPVNDVSLQ